MFDRFYTAAKSYSTTIRVRSTDDDATLTVKLDGAASYGADRSAIAKAVVSQDGPTVDVRVKVDGLGTGTAVDTLVMLKSKASDCLTDLLFGDVAKATVAANKAK